jgi:hypothetical protein
MQDTSNNKSSNSSSAVHEQLEVPAQDAVKADTHTVPLSGEYQQQSY